MRSTSFGNLVPSLGLDSGDGFVTLCQQGQPAQVGKGDLKRLAGVSVLGELDSTGEAEESGGLEQGGQGIGGRERVDWQARREGVRRQSSPSWWTFSSNNVGEWIEFRIAHGERGETIT